MSMRTPQTYIGRSTWTVTSTGSLLLFSLILTHLALRSSPACLHAMFCKATLLTVALALLASANPVAREPTPAAGLRIPLHRPRSLKDSDGVFDHARAVQEIVKTKK